MASAQCRRVSAQINSSEMSSNVKFSPTARIPEYFVSTARRAAKTVHISAVYLDGPLSYPDEINYNQAEMQFKKKLQGTINKMRVCTSRAKRSRPDRSMLLKILGKASAHLRKGLTPPEPAKAYVGRAPHLRAGNSFRSIKDVERKIYSKLLQLTLNDRLSLKDITEFKYKVFRELFVGKGVQYGKTSSKAWILLISVICKYYAAQEAGSTGHGSSNTLNNTSQNFVKGELSNSASRIAEQHIPRDKLAILKELVLFASRFILEQSHPLLLRQYYRAVGLQMPERVLSRIYFPFQMRLLCRQYSVKTAQLRSLRNLRSALLRPSSRPRSRNQPPKVSHRKLKSILVHRKKRRFSWTN